MVKAHSKIENIVAVTSVLQFLYCYRPAWTSRRFKCNPGGRSESSVVIIADVKHVQPLFTEEDSLPQRRYWESTWECPLEKHDISTEESREYWKCPLSFILSYRQPQNSLTPFQIIENIIMRTCRTNRSTIRMFKLLSSTTIPFAKE